VEANLAAAKLRLGEVKLIGNSHAHFDHAGGIAALQKRTGATVLASARSAEALRTGCPTADDPQAGFGCAVNGFPPVTGPMRVIQDGEVVRLGKVALTAHLTPGHTPGSTTWTWRACEGKRCLDLVYADSLTTVSAGDFRFTPMKSDLEATFDKVAKLPCDVLLTTHPDASDTLERLSSGTAKAGDPALRNQCAPYARRARRNLAKRIAKEAAASAATSP
jgi:metallo-beta-lactamase class B